MFKFFRQYNKFILAIGAAFLMLAFLIEPTLSIFQRGPEDQPLGRVSGERLTMGDQQAAAMELEVLEYIHPATGWLSRNLSEGDPLKWLLMKHDAQRMGLTASDAEVQSVLEAMGYYEEELRQRAAAMRVPPDYIHRVLRSWLTLEQYRDLVLGRTYVNPIFRLQAIYLVMQAEQTGDFQRLMQAYGMLEDAFGHHRLSEPVIQHMLRDMQTTVAGEVALIDARHYLDAVPEPSDAEVQALFEQYRDVLPGQGEPYGFGYRIPARVKIEYLAIPIDRVRQQVQIDEVDALVHFEQNIERFRPDADPDADELPAWTASERTQVINELRDREANALANRIVRAAQSMLVQHARQLEQQGVYRVVPDGYQPPSLREIADRIEEQFGVRPERFDDAADQWMAVDNLHALPGIGQATLAGRSDVAFTRYVRSAVELGPAEDDPLVGLGLQAMMPSAPLERADGSRYLFRLVDAQAAHVPESIEPVIEQVRRDARLRNAYEQELLPKREEWLARARSEGFETLVESEGLASDVLRPTPRREPDARGQLVVPSVPGVGRSEAFIEAIFSLAGQVTQDGQQPISEIDEPERLGTVEVDSQLSLALFRVDQYQPVTEQQYRQIAGSPQMTSLVSQMVTGSEDDPFASLTLEAVKARVGYQPAERELETGDTSRPTQPQRRPGQI